MVNRALADYLSASELYDVSDQFTDGRGEFRRKRHGQRYIRLFEERLSDNILDLDLDHIAPDQLRTLLALHLVHPISRKELVRMHGKNLDAIHQFVLSLQKQTADPRTCPKLSADVLRTLEQIPILPYASS